MKRTRKPATSKPGADNPSPAFRRAHRLARWLIIATLLLALPMSSVYFREPFWIGIGVLAAIPWVALALVRGFGGLYAIDTPANSTQRADLSPLLLVPGFGLLCHAIVTVNLVSWTPVWLYAVIGGVAMAGAVALASPAARKSGPLLIAYALLMSLYGGGLAVFGDVWFDGAAPEVLTRPILDHRSRSIGKYTAVHYVKVGSWGPYPEANEVEVSREFDGKHKQGEPVCIFLHRGALGLTWYDAGDCARAAP